MKFRLTTLEPIIVDPEREIVNVRDGVGWLERAPRYTFFERFLDIANYECVLLARQFESGHAFFKVYKKKACLSQHCICPVKIPKTSGMENTSWI